MKCTVIPVHLTFHSVRRTTLFAQLHFQHEQEMHHFHTNSLITLLYKISTPTYKGHVTLALSIIFRKYS